MTGAIAATAKWAALAFYCRCRYKNGNPARPYGQGKCLMRWHAEEGDFRCRRAGCPRLR